MKALILTAILCFSAHANTTFFDLTCSHPGLHYVNSFNFEGTIEAEMNNEGSLRVYRVRPEVTVRKSGFNSEEETIKLPWMSGEAKVIDSDLTLKPFTNILLRSRENKVLLNLNLDYPAVFSSTLRLEDGMTYKSTCQLKEKKTCLIPSSIYSLRNSEDFKLEKLGVVERFLPSFERVVPTEKLKATHKMKGIVLFAYYTFQDEVDGGNTYGEITNESGEVIATITDGDIYECPLY